MNGRKIPKRDDVFRHVLFPVSFRSKRFAHDKMIKFEQRDGLLKASLAWERYLPTTPHLHAYGCRLARDRNELGSGQRRSVYCGAYRFVAGAIRQLPTEPLMDDVIAVEVNHQIENGQLAHIDLQFRIRHGADIEASKTAIIDRLWAICSGPLRHVCECDTDLNPHPSSVLTDPPSGPSINNRSFLRKCWCMIVFYVGSWVYRRITKVASISA